MKCTGSFRMGRKAWLSLSLAAALLASLAMVNVAGTARAADEEEPPLLKHMNGINDGYKQLRRLARSGAFDDDTVKMVREMQTHALAAKNFDPPMAEKIPPAQRAKFLMAYRTTQVKLIKELLDLEMALLQGNADRVTEHVTNLALIKKEGHDNFIEE